MLRHARLWLEKHVQQCYAWYEVYCSPWPTTNDWFKSIRSFGLVRSQAEYAFSLWPPEPDKLLYGAD